MGGQLTFSCWPAQLVRRIAKGVFRLPRIVKYLQLKEIAYGDLEKRCSGEKKARNEKFRLRRKMLRAKIASCAERNQPRGGCCAKGVFLPECCARATAQQLINALLTTDVRGSPLVASPLMFALTQTGASPPADTPKGDYLSIFYGPVKDRSYQTTFAGFSCFSKKNRKNRKNKQNSKN